MASHGYDARGWTVVMTVQFLGGATENLGVIPVGVGKSAGQTNGGFSQRSEQLILLTKLAACRSAAVKNAVLGPNPECGYGFGPRMAIMRPNVANLGGGTEIGVRIVACCAKIDSGSNLDPPTAGVRRQSQ